MRLDTAIEQFRGEMRRACLPAEQAFLSDLEALDEAEKPDPWALLTSVRNLIPESTPGHMAKRAIDEATAWRRDNPDA